MPSYPVFNPGYAEANARQIRGTAAADDVIRGGMTPQAAEKALRRIGDVLAKYPIARS